MRVLDLRESRFVHRSLRLGTSRTGPHMGLCRQQVQQQRHRVQNGIQWLEQLVCDRLHALRFLLRQLRMCGLLQFRVRQVSCRPLRVGRSGDSVCTTRLATTLQEVRQSSSLYQLARR